MTHCASGCRRARLLLEVEATLPFARILMLTTVVWGMCVLHLCVDEAKDTMSGAIAVHLANLEPFLRVRQKILVGEILAVRAAFVLEKLGADVTVNLLDGPLLLCTTQNGIVVICFAKM